MQNTLLALDFRSSFGFGNFIYASFHMHTYICSAVRKSFKYEKRLTVHFKTFSFKVPHYLGNAEI